MRNLFLGLVAAATLLPGAARAMEPSAPAQDRATLYQREVRAALTERGWRITQDDAGKLTAERKAPQDGTQHFIAGDDINAYVRLQIDFRAGGKNHADARASLCHYQSFRSDRSDSLLYPPSPYRDPKLTQEYRDVLAAAESRLAKSHHAEATMATNPQNDGNERKVAMK